MLKEKFSSDSCSEDSVECNVKFGFGIDSIIERPNGSYGEISLSNDMTILNEFETKQNLDSKWKKFLKKPKTTKLTANNMCQMKKRKHKILLPYYHNPKNEIRINHYFFVKLHSVHE